MYIYHALINSLSVHMIHINLNMIFYTHVEHIPIKTTYTKYYTRKKKKKEKKKKERKKEKQQKIKKKKRKK